MVRLITVFDPFDDLNSLRFVRRCDFDRLEPALQRTIFLDRFAELGRGGRADALDFAAREGGLQDVRRVEAAFGRTGADQRVQLVDEDDVLRIVGQFAHDRLHALLELSAIFRPRDDQAQVEPQNPLVGEEGRHVAVDDALRQPFDDRRLADAGLAYQHRVVLRPAAKDLNDAVDLSLSSNQRIEFAFEGGFCKVAAEFEQVRSLFAGVGVALHVGLSHEVLADVGKPQPALVEDFGGDRILFAQQSEQQVLGADVAIAEPLGLFGGEGQHAFGLARKRQVDLRGDAVAHDRPIFYLLTDQFDVGVRAMEEPRGEVFVLTDQSQQDVFGFDLGRAELACFVAGKENYATRFFRISFEHLTIRL